MKANYQGEYITKHYYIIKVICDNGKYTYYKIGEANNRSRPNKLVEKYRALRANDAELLAFEELPTHKDARLQDKNIHSHIDASILRKSNSMQMAYLLKEEDGKDEFFEAVQPLADQEVIDYVKGIVASISCSEYTGKRIKIKNATLDYDPEKYHLVDSKLIENYILTIPEVYNIVYETTSKSVLLVGQFEQDFICSIACFHKLYIWHDTKEQIHDFSLQRINNRITYIESLEELLDLEMKFDLIIANPPYGKIGANITKTIIDNVDFDEYVNLLPANDYKRNDSKDLFNYQSDMISIKDGFADAAVTTHLAKIHKNKVNNMTTDEFTVAQFIDPQLNKYFKQNYSRSYYAFDKFDSGRGDNVLSWTTEKTFILASRDINHGGMPKSKTCSTYRWNVLGDITNKELVDKHITGRAIKGNFIEVEFSGINFKSNTEKKNFVKFIYTGNEAKFVQKLFTAINCDGGSFIVHHIFPKVDWTREWTVEEILKDYGYTAKEIQEVMDDLKNFKGMED